MTPRERQEMQQARYHDAAASGWWSSLLVSERWALVARYPDTGVRRIFDGERHHVDPFPHGYYDPPSRCVCVRCLP